MTWNGEHIHIEFLYPPIPNRNFDYCAYLEGHEESGNYGYGISPEIAVAELIQGFWENGE